MPRKKFLFWTTGRPPTPKHTIHLPSLVRQTQHFQLDHKQASPDHLDNINIEGKQADFMINDIKFDDAINSREPCEQGSIGHPPMESVLFVPFRAAQT